MRQNKNPPPVPEVESRWGITDDEINKKSGVWAFGCPFIIIVIGIPFILVIFKFFGFLNDMSFDSSDLIPEFRNPFH